MFDVLKLSGTSRVEDYSHLVIMKHMNVGPNFCGVAGGVRINPTNMKCAKCFTQLCQNISNIGLCHMIIGQNIPMRLSVVTMGGYG